MLLIWNHTSRSTFLTWATHCNKTVTINVITFKCPGWTSHALQKSTSPWTEQFPVHPLLLLLINDKVFKQKNVWQLKCQPGNFTGPFYKSASWPPFIRGIAMIHTKAFHQFVNASTKYEQCNTVSNASAGFPQKGSWHFRLWSNQEPQEEQDRRDRQRMGWYYITTTLIFMSSGLQKPPSGIRITCMKIQQKQTAFNTSLPNVHLLTRFQTDETKLLLKCCLFWIRSMRG